MRKSLITFAMTLALLLVSVGIKAQTVVTHISEGFEKTGTPTGWNISDYEPSSMSTSYGWKFVTDGGSKCARAYLYGTSALKARLKTKQFTPDSLDAVMLKFKVKMNATSTYAAALLNVYVSTDGGSTYTNVIDSGITPTSKTDWKEYAYSLEDYKGQSIVIVFEAVSPGTSYSYICLDDVLVKTAPTCQTPEDLSVAGVSSTGATLNWNLDTRFGKNPGRYSVTLKDTAGNVAYYNAANLDQSATFTGLTANTMYIASVRSDCQNIQSGSYGYSDSVFFEFTTLPAAIGTPFYENFDSLTAGTTFPSGYYTQNASIANGTSPFGATGGKYVQLKTTSSDNAYIIFPLMNIASNDMQMDFFIKCASNVSYKAGYTTDPYKADAMYFVQTGTLETANWENIRFNTANKPSSFTELMGCVFIESGANATIYLDEVTIDTIPSCTRPENLTCSNVTSDQLSLSWDMSNASSFVITAMSLPDSTVTTFTTIASPFLVTGLLANTRYEFTVQGVCGASDSSQVSRPVSVKTECGIAPNPLFLENFDNVTILPDCWVQGWHYQNTTSGKKDTPFLIDSSVKHGSSGKSMKLQDQGVGTISYLSTGALTIDSAYKYTLSIWVNRTTYTSSLKPNEGIQLWVSDSPTDTTNGEKLAYIHREPSLTPMESAAGWYQYEYVIPVKGVKYISIIGISEYGAGTNFDEVEVKLAPSCPKVSGVAAENITANSVDLTWTPGGTESQWEVKYTVREGGSKVLDSTVVTSSTSITLRGLNGNTQYNLQSEVRAICDDGDTAEVVSLSTQFTTKCDALNTLPYTMGFEANETFLDYSTTYYYPQCWTRYNDYSGTSAMYSHYPYVNTSATYAHTGSRGVYSLVGSSYAANSIMILPDVDTTLYDINNLRIKFWAKESSATYSMYLYLGVMTDITDFSTFTVVDSVLISGMTWTEYVMSLARYTGNGTHIGINFSKAGLVSTTSYTYLDDVTLEEIPNCLEIDGGVAVSDNTENSVKITMQDSTAYTGWSYAFAVAGTPLDEMTPIDTVGASIVLTGLNSATNYDIYVRRNCGNEYGPWSSKISFATTSVPAYPPYTCGFENETENAQWQFVIGATPTNMFAIGADTAGVHSNDSSIYVSNNANGTYGYNNSSCATRTFAYRTIHFDSKGYQVEFFWKCPGGEGTETGTRYDYGRVMLLPASENIPEGQSNTSISSTSTGGFPTTAIFFDPDDKSAMYKDGDDWHFMSKFIDFTGKAGNYNLVLVWNNDGSGGNAGPLAIDDISITPVSCFAPTDILASSDSAGITLTVVSQLTDNLWEFIVDSVEFNKATIPATPMQRRISTTGIETFTGLRPNTLYYYSARVICGEGDTSLWFSPKSIRTQCSAYATPYSEGFEDVAGANCWQMMSSQEEDASVGRSTDKHHGSGSASLKAFKANVISPEFAVDSLTHYMINGWALATNKDSVTINVGVYDYQEQEYQPITDVLIPVKDDWIEFTAYFTALDTLDDARHGKNIAIACGDNTVYFDDIVVDLTPECPKPTEVLITNIQANSFDISFTDNAGASTWIVYTDTTKHVITTNPATVSGLTAHHSYNVSIAAICSSTDTSYTTDCGTVTTLCDKMPLPWTCGFEASEGYTGGTSFNATTSATVNLEANCWTVFNNRVETATTGYPYAYVYNSTSSTYFHTGSQGLYSYFSTTGKDMYYILPDFAHAANMLKVKFWYKNSATGTTSSQLKFGYFTDLTTDTSFVSIMDLTRLSSWTEKEILTNTAGYNIPANARLGFKMAQGTASGTIYLDDITISKILSCSDPDAPNVFDITATTANVTISDQNSTHNTWEYVYGTAGFDPNTATPTRIDSVSFSLSGLDGYTDYDVYVRAVCGAGDSSNYVKASFKTLCLPFHVTEATPFAEDFNSYNYNQYLNTGTCYTVLNEPTTNTYWAKVYPTSTPSATASTYYFYGHSADRFDRCLYWPMSNTYLTEGTVLREFKLDGGTTYEVSAWVRNSTSTTYQSKVSAMMGGSATSLDTMVSLIVDGATISSRVIEGTTTTPYNELYKQIKYYLTPDSTGVYYLGYNCKVNNSTTSTYLYFDDWTIEPFTGCIPVIPVVDSVTTTSAYVSVDDTTSYQFEYVLNDTTKTPTVVTTNTFVINGLSASTSYTLYMRTYCEATNYSEWVSVQFRTECGAVTDYPYTEGFEGSFPPACWSQFYYGTTTAYNWTASTSATYIHSGAKAAYISYSSTNGKAALVTGEFNLTNPYGYYVRLWSYRSAATSYPDKTDEALHIGYLNAPITAANISSVNEIGVIHRNPTNPPVETGEGKYMYEFEVPAGVTGSVWFSFDFHSQNGLGYAFDDLTIEPIPSCVTPKSGPVVVSTTKTTATVTMDMKGKPQVEVAWAISTNVDSIVGTATTTTGQVIATDLAANTTYKFKYRYLCEGNDTSDWSPFTSGKTKTTDCFQPENVRLITEVNDHHADIAWGGAPDATGYEYELKRGSTVVDTGVVTNDTISFDSLTANTAYTFRVRTLCAEDTTAWVTTLSFTTDYGILDIPFVCDFEENDINVNWKFRKISSSGDNVFVINGATKKSGSSSMYVSSNSFSYSYLTGATVSDAEIMLNIPAGGYSVSYDWNCNGEISTTNVVYDFGRVFLVPASVNVTGTTYTAFNKSLPTGAIALDGNAPLLKNTNWPNHNEVFIVPDSGVYKLVVLWANDASAYDPPFAIDNIRIEAVSCMPVNAITMTEINPFDAKAVIAPYDSTVTVEYALSADTVIDSLTWNVATVDTLVFNGLTPETTYYLYARHICSSTDTSMIKSISFETPNSRMILLPFVSTFEATDTTMGYWTFTQGAAPHYFTVGTEPKNNGNRSLYITDGTSYSYNIASAISWSYAYAPVNIPAGKLDVSFQWNCAGETTYDYGRLFLVPGAVVPQANVQMTGMTATTLPADAIGLDGGKLNLSTDWVDVDNEVEVQNAGVYNLVVAWHNDGTSGTMPPLAIDDIRIKQLTCPKIAADSLELDSVSTDMIRIKINGKDSLANIMYHVASDASFTDTLAAGITTDSIISVTGLSASSWYNVRIWKICGVGDTSSVTSTQFRTLCGIMTSYPFIEDFEGYATGSSTTGNNVLTENCWLVTEPTTTSYYYVTATASYVHGGSRGLYIYNSTSGIHTFAMPKVDTLAGMQLSMWYKNYGTTSTYAKLEVGYLTNPDNTSSFVLLKSAPLTTDYTEFVVDYPTNLAASARPAFRANGTYYMYVDDIRLNKVVEGEQYYDILCNGQDYNAHGFSYFGGELTAGDTTFTRLQRSTVAGAPDSIIYGHVTVLPVIRTTYRDTICAGVPYNKGMWNIPNPVSGTQFQTFQSSLGCDSTVYLTLYVCPSQEQWLDTICQGDSLIFFGQTLKVSGDYVAYTVNKFQCNDTIYLHLTVVDSTATTVASICQGSYYEFEGKRYTQTGIYRVPGFSLYGCPLTKILDLTVTQNVNNVDTSFCHGGQLILADGTVVTTPGQYTCTIHEITGCDVTYNYNVSMDSIISVPIYDEACENHPYTGYGGLVYRYISKDTTFTVTTRTLDAKCDSQSVVTIHVVPAIWAQPEVVTLPAGQTYTWHDRSFSKSTFVRDTLIAESTGCDSICTLNLTIGDVPPTGVENIELLEVSVVPNPVNAGQTSFIYGNFSNVKSVEVLNSFGQVVDTFVPSTYPIEVQGINAAGIYYVRVTTEDDRVAVEKLIVK